MNYAEFLKGKSHLAGDFGFKPTFMPDKLFDFQKALVKYAVRKGRAALFEDCGMGKCFQALTWAENVVRYVNKPVLILTPLSVARVYANEGAKFGIECSRDPKKRKGNIVANYEQLHKFEPSDFGGVVCSESSILKNFDGAIKHAVTEFVKRIKFRLLETATAAPNDYIELGTSAEALGHMGYMDMLGKFFRSTEHSLHPHSSLVARYGATFDDAKFRFKPHAESNFWRWVCSWARACRKPSDLGFKDGDFILPKLVENLNLVKRTSIRDGYLFNSPAHGLKEQREEKRATIKERCEIAAELITKRKDASVSWCHLNDEADLLEDMIKDSRQVAGAHSDEEKEELFTAFESGELKHLVIKPKIGAFGLNWQHCNYITWFVSHSYEQYYQAIRRCLRYGQKREVTVEVIASDGEDNVMRNLQRKSKAAAKMFDSLVASMNDAIHLEHKSTFEKPVETPTWLSKIPS